MNAALSNEQQEIVQLLRQELLEVAEQAPALLGDAAPWAGCETQALLLDNFAEAASLAGLPGFEAACRQLVDELNYLHAEQTPLSAELRALCSRSPLLLADYLAALGGEFELDTANALLMLLADSAWPHPLAEAPAQAMRHAFAQHQLVLACAEPQLPHSADSHMVSLAIAEDVRQELVDGMLLELPSQVQCFEASIHAYLASAAFADLTQAQRIAHTLKGAANIVGVAGIANLMHYLEDLLEQGAKRWQQDAPAGFSDLLLEAADCLAAQAEYLCGLGPKPQDAVAVMQQVLDWLRSVHSGIEPAACARQEAGVSNHAEGADFAPRAQQPAATEPLALHNTTAVSETAVAARVTADETDEPDEKHFIHLPDTTAQELLRLSGEAHIANTQLTAQLATLQTSIQLTDRYHRKIRQMATELELIVQTQSALHAATTLAVDDQLDPLEMERYSELYSFSNQLLELTADSYEAVSQIAGQITDLNNLVYQQKQHQRESQTLLLQMRLLPVASLSSRFQRCVRQASRLTHKPARLEIKGEATLLDSRVLNRIADPIMHLLRNAVDHGLESQQARAAAGKAAQGCIELSFSLSGETVTIRCSDDGAGLDFARIRNVAQARGLLAANEQADEAMLKQIIMMPGFSTRAAASQTSGRGIGLDAVLAEVRALKGNLNVQTAADGTRFTLTVPTSIVSGHAVLAEVANGLHKQKMAIVTRNIEQIVFVEHTAIRRDAEGAYFTYQEQRLALLEFSHLVGFSGTSASETKALMVVKRNDGSRVAVALAAMLASQDMVIKPLNAYTFHPPGVIGATILGDGSVAPVVDLHELPGLSLGADGYQRLRVQREKIAELERAQQVDVPLAVIVDDSLSARRSLAQFMSDLGMEVRTAKDGFEAIKILAEKRPALMLVDLEMPRMNGLELTAHVRSRDDMKHVPIIMITSRTTEKHRQLATKAGVNSYLSKPWTDEDLLATIAREVRPTAPDAEPLQARASGA